MLYAMGQREDRLRVRAIDSACTWLLRSSRWQQEGCTVLDSILSPYVCCGRRLPPYAANATRRGFKTLHFTSVFLTTRGSR
jgi:hypothetical protein